ncbi:hypothetical protein ES319_A09G110600v1 [Gossypium barbadense]|uniref:2Fe-2S ferredoxin-type domain-containing protein n=1 Tax=Gossypium barbadense TaxID=3634 RepID=A0A5J5UE91_GOSBA|nr:hypothetical protein ES319_A09G110600v1 [Gossypium barbadense]
MVKKKKNAKDTTTKQRLVFAVNGQRFEVYSIDPSTTLLEFLRSQTPFKSVKLSCGEGGCGACIVLLSKYDHVHNKVEDFTVSSCLTFLCSINGCSIITAEGIGNSKDGFHPIQQRFSGFHASQCGFCTPGICVSLYAPLVNADKMNNRAEPSPGFSKLTVSEAEKSIAGNLCRCTGYRLIVDACKSFATDVDMVDLGFNSYWRKGESNEVKLSRLPPYNCNYVPRVFPEFLKKETVVGLNLGSERYHWYSPVSLKELQGLLQMEANGGTSMKIIVGNTGMGYYKELVHYDKYIDLRYIPELSIVRKDSTGIEIGAAVMISKAIEALKEENQGGFSKEAKLVFKKIGDHMDKIASKFIRLEFDDGPEETFSFRYCYNTTFCGYNFRNNDRVVSSDACNKLLFETYRAAPRPLGNALPYLNVAFLAQVSLCKNPTGFMLKNYRFAFGAYGTKHSIRVKEVEEFLYGKLLSFGVLYDAIKLLETLVIPEDGTSSPAYRSSLDVGFLFEFLSPLIDSPIDFSDGLVNRYNRTLLSKNSNQQHDLGQIKFPTLLSSSRQVIQLNKEYHPVGEPTIKTGAILQASGEAVYIDDIPSPKDCLYEAFIYSLEPRARVKGIKFNPGSSPKGVIALITSKDIPGLNLGSKTVFGTELLYADDLTEGVGQRIAFVVADTQKNANIAADLAVVDYDKENIEPPILSVEEAVERSSFYAPLFYPE